MDKSSARDEIFARIGKALGRSPATASEAERRAKDRIANPPKPVRPAFTRSLAERFTEQLEAAGASVTRLAGLADVAQAVSDYLRREQLASEIVVTRSVLLDPIAWPATLNVTRREARDTDKVSVTGALHAIAETGTLVLASAPDTPTTLNFLPDHHLVVIEDSALVANFEDVWPALRSRFPELPRTVNLISGPSKTADVEQTLQLGAHGPRKLCVLLVSADA